MVHTIITSIALDVTRALYSSKYPLKNNAKNNANPP